MTGNVVYLGIYNYVDCLAYVSEYSELIEYVHKHIHTVWEKAYVRYFYQHGMYIWHMMTDTRGISYLLVFSGMLCKSTAMNCLVELSRQASIHCSTLQQF